MGLPVSLHVRGPQARGSATAHAVAAFYQRLRADDAMFSPWRVGSAVSRIRRGQLALPDAPQLVQEVAQLCAQARERTGGAFDAWRPDPHGRRSFDPTGLVKGWSVERSFQHLASDLGRLGPHDLLACAGGDIVMKCSRTDTPDWVIGIENPRDTSSLVTTLTMRSGGVATSGTAARGEHILDPRSGARPATTLSASVIGPTLTWSDVYATAVFVDGDRAAGWLSSQPGYAAVLVTGDGVVRPLVSSKALRKF